MFSAVNQPALLSMVSIRSFIIVFALIGTRFIFEDLDRSVDKVRNLLDEIVEKVKVDYVEKRPKKRYDCREWSDEFRASLTNWRIYIVSIGVLILLYFFGIILTEFILKRMVTAFLAERYSGMLFNNIKKVEDSKDQVYNLVYNLVWFECYCNFSTRDTYLR